MLSNYTQSLLQEIEPYRTTGQSRTAQWGDLEAFSSTRLGAHVVVWIPTFPHYLLVDTWSVSSLLIYVCVQPTCSDNQLCNSVLPWVRTQA